MYGALGGNLFGSEKQIIQDPHKKANYPYRMRKRLYLLLSLLLFVAFFSSCKKAVNTFISASGSPGEVLLVLDGVPTEGTTATAIKAMLQQEVPALTQVEPWMHVQTVAQRDFGDFLRNTRNIVLLRVNGEIYSQNSIKYTYNEWANGQLLVVLQVPSADSISSLVEQSGDKIRHLLLRHELFRYAEAWQKDYSSKADKYCMELFDAHINMPEDMLSYKKGENFLWMSNTGSKKRSDMVVYALPYRGPEDLSQAVMLARRDSVLGKNIPGATPDSKMTTLQEGLTHQYIRMPDKSLRGTLHGLWETSGNSLMGGPFVMHAFVAPQRKRVYYVEGFVYYPSENKRELVRRLEAALFSLRPAEVDTFDPAPLKKMWWTDIH